MSKEVDNTVKKIEEWMGGQLQGFTENCYIGKVDTCSTCGSKTARGGKEALTIVLDVDERSMKVYAIKFLCPSCASASGVGV
tara:strand:- start:81 stop:326 length:246 start_codon:yes stop_codon:yes gene_type:complete